MEERIEPKIGVVVVAGGSGLRAGGRVPKQFQFLGQLPMLAHTINVLDRALPNSELVVVVAADRVEYWRNLAARFDVAKHIVVSGGEERFYSVKRGVEALSDGVDIIAVHDGARPLCSVEMIRRCVDSAISNGSAIPVVAISDSLREVMDDGQMSQSVDRSKMRAVQTPQVFDAMLLRSAYNQPYSDLFTDDASVVEQMGERVWLCEGEVGNIKVTTNEDIIFARQILDNDGEEQ